MTSKPENRGIIQMDVNQSICLFIVSRQFVTDLKSHIGLPKFNPFPDVIFHTRASDEKASKIRHPF